MMQTSDSVASAGIYVWTRNSYLPKAAVLSQGSSYYLQEGWQWGQEGSLLEAGHRDKYDRVATGFAMYQTKASRPSVGH